MGLSMRKVARIKIAYALHRIVVKRRVNGKLVMVCIAIASGKANAQMIVDALNKRG